MKFAKSFTIKGDSTQIFDETRKYLPKCGFKEEGASKNTITEDERRIIKMFAENSMENATKTLKEGIKKISETKHSYKVSNDEQNILNKWKKNNN